MRSMKLLSWQQIYSTILLLTLIWCVSCYKQQWKPLLLDQNNSINSVKAGALCKIVLKDNIRGFLNWQQDWFVNRALERNIHILPASYQGKDIDVLLYHAPNHNFFLDPPSSAYPVRVMVSMEQPKYASAFADLEYLQRSFHLLVTYSLSSTYPGTTLPNLPITYYPTHILSPEAVLNKPDMKIKTGYGTKVLVATFTSNCGNAGAKERFKYLEELMSHIEVHSYGQCKHNREEPKMAEDPAWPPIAQRRARKIKVLSNYMFYLAFENLPIDDYVSEKVFEGLVAGTVPVYRGAATIHKFMPSNDSFINANDLNPKQLADLLKSIASAPEEYEKFMRFKSEPLSSDFYRIAEMSYVHPNAVQRVCSEAQKMKTRNKIYKQE